jgi:trans-aconitate methyltransferase
MSASNDKWASGAAYETYMGRWSRKVARLFVEWLGVKREAHWLELGCGTGALTGTILELAGPASITAVDPAEPFVAHAQRSITDPRVSFSVAGVGAIPKRAEGFDAAVSGLVLNFLPEPERALAELRERTRPNGVIAAYVWDYSEGMQFLRRFWDEASEDPRAVELDEGPRFPLCHAPALAQLFRDAGLTGVETTELVVATSFENFDDYWQPFLAGTGPAPSYVASLAPEQRESLRKNLERRLPVTAQGRIELKARAWAVKGQV